MSVHGCLQLARVPVFVRPSVPGLPASVSRSVFTTVVKLSSYRSDSSAAGGSGRVSSTGSGCYPSDYDVHGGGKTYRHKGRSKSATCKYADEKSKKKKKSSTSPSRSSNSVSLVSIPNTIKLSMLNSGLLPLCKHRFRIHINKIIGTY